MITNIKAYIRYPRLIKRALKHFWQRRVKGWDDSDTWSLDYKIIEFTLPRLKRYKEIAAHKVTPGSVETNEEWVAIVESMITYMELYIEHDGWVPSEFKEEYDKGRENFFKYFHALWW